MIVITFFAEILVLVGKSSFVQKYGGYIFANIKYIETIDDKKI